MNLLTEQTALLQYLQNPKSYKTKYPSIFFFFFFLRLQILKIWRIKKWVSLIMQSFISNQQKLDWESEKQQIKDQFFIEH